MKAEFIQETISSHFLPKIASLKKIAIAIIQEERANSVITFLQTL